MIKVIIAVLIDMAAGGFIGWIAYEMGAKGERAKIVDHICKAAGRAENDPDGNIWGRLMAIAIAIKAGDHLK